jgi:hypothetical protein
LKVIKIIYLPVSREKLDIQNVHFLFGGENGFVGIGSMLIDEHFLKKTKFIHCHPLSTSEYYEKTKESKVKEILYLDIVKMVIILTDDNEMIFLSLEKQVSYGDFTIEFQSCFQFSRIYEILEEEPDDYEENEKILSFKLINNFLLNENAVNVDILNNNPNEIHNLLVGTNHRMVLFVLGFQSYSSSSLTGNSSFGIIGFVELNNIMNHMPVDAIISAQQGTAGLFDLSMTVTLTELHQQQPTSLVSMKPPGYYSLNRSSSSGQLKTEQVQQQQSPESLELTKHVSHVQGLYRTNSLKIEKKWIEWNFYPSSSIQEEEEESSETKDSLSELLKKDADEEENQQFYHKGRSCSNESSFPEENPSASVISKHNITVVKRYERNKAYFQECFKKIHYF